MTQKSPYQLVEDILELVDRHGFTTDNLDNVESLRLALDDLIYAKTAGGCGEWWETYHGGMDTNYEPPF